MYIIPPVEDLRALAAATAGTYTSKTCMVPHVISGYMSGYNTVSSGIETVDGYSQYYIYRNGYSTTAWCLLPKIEAGKYSKLYLKVKVTHYSSTVYRKAWVELYTTLNFNQASGGSSVKIFKLSDVNETVESLMAQEGITMDISSNVAVSTQMIEIDVSSIETDFYLGFYNCDLNMCIYEAYLE